MRAVIHGSPAAAAGPRRWGTLWQRAARVLPRTQQAATAAPASALWVARGVCCCVAATPPDAGCCCALGRCRLSRVTCCWWNQSRRVCCLCWERRLVWPLTPVCQTTAPAVAPQTLPPAAACAERLHRLLPPLLLHPWLLLLPAHRCEAAPPVALRRAGAAACAVAAACCHVRSSCRLRLPPASAACQRQLPRLGVAALRAPPHGSCGAARCRVGCSPRLQHRRRSGRPPTLARCRRQRQQLLLPASCAAPLQTPAPAAGTPRCLSPCGRGTTIVRDLRREAQRHISCSNTMKVFPPMVA